jgi:hypothetical protein
MTATETADVRTISDDYTGRLAAPTCASTWGKPMVERSDR